VDEMKNSLDNEFSQPVYSRGNNPTVAILRKKMAALEGMEDALIMASGCAAISSAIIANVKAGDHIICVNSPYGWTASLLRNLLPRFGVKTTFVDGTEIENFEKEICKNTSVIYLESPNSFLFELQDLQAVAALAKSKNITTIIDNSYATPLHQKPADLGIDLVLHTASKYLCGHSDVVAGVICGSSGMIRKIFTSEFMTLGGIISPFDAWLMIRGLRTLPLRLKQSTTSALKVISYLENQSLVDKIFYPFHYSNPQLELAKKQMIAANGMFTVAFRTNSKEKMTDFCSWLKVFKMAVSWGGHESLISPVVAFPETHDNTALRWNLVRFYVGLDEPELLVKDLEGALEGLK
jgi:cystathionine beta-lyase/cystathionine gamma-synthase